MTTRHDDRTGLGVALAFGALLTAVLVSLMMAPNVWTPDKNAIFAFAGPVVPADNDGGYDYTSRQYMNCYPDMTITYRQAPGPDPEIAFLSTEFVVNGESSGTGEVGVRNVVASIQRLTKGSTVLFYPVHAVWDEGAPVVDWMLNVGRQILAACSDRGITALFSSTGPIRPAFTPYGMLCAVGEEEYLENITEKPDFLLTWQYRGEDESAPNAKYYLNGEFMGLGALGVRHATNEIRKAADHCRLLIYPARMFQPPAYGSSDRPPYAGCEWPLLREVQRKHIRLQLAPDDNERNEGDFAMKMYGSSTMPGRGALNGERTARE